MNRAAYMRTYRKTSAKAMRHREFVRGMATLRAAAVELFRKLGDTQMDCRTVANMLAVLDPARPDAWSTEQPKNQP